MLCLRTSKTKGALTATCARWAHSNTAKGSPLRSLIADITATSILNDPRKFHSASWISQELLWEALESIHLRLPKGTKLVARPHTEFLVDEDVPGQH
jgi:hypothetical protein